MVFDRVDVAGGVVGVPPGGRLVPPGHPANMDWRGACNFFCFSLRSDHKKESIKTLISYLIVLFYVQRFFNIFIFLIRLV